MEFKKLLSFFGIPYQVYKTTSRYNTEIIVSSVFGQPSISVSNLTQTGPIVEMLWNNALLKVDEKNISSVLVLGVGGGSIIKVLKNKFPKIEIEGVEIDKKMIDIGNKYFKLDSYKADIKITDAFNFVKNNKKHYDLVCVDLLIGRNPPKKLSSLSFFRNIKKLLTKKGVVIINTLRLKGTEDNSIFYSQLQKVFKRVTMQKPLVNTMIYCR